MSRAHGPADADRPPRPSRGRRLLTRFVPLVLVLGLGAYAAACAIAPIPEPEVRVAELASAEELPAASLVQDIVDTQKQPTAAGWLEDDTVWSNDDKAYPIASITKLVTALVGLEREPLALGDDGPVHVWTSDDVARTREIVEQDGVAFPIAAGTEVTRLEMLELALIPSANDFATAYAYAVFGSGQAYLDAVAAWAKAHGLASLSVEEPSGLDPGNRASAGDVVRIARLALENPVMARIVGTSSLEVPWGYGTVRSTNPLFGVLPGVVGVKTGYTASAGYALAAAAVHETDGRSLTAIAVLLGRETQEARAGDGATVLEALGSTPRTVSLVVSGQRIGTLTSADGRTAALVADTTASAVLAPGETAELGASLASDSTTGTVSVRTPSGELEVPIRLSTPLPQPDYWWRFTHPFALLG